MENLSTVYLRNSRQSPSLDVDLASRTIKARPWVVVVEMDPAPERSGAILIPDGNFDAGDVGQAISGETRRRLRPDVATVLSVGYGSERHGGEETFGPRLFPGDRVVVLPHAGIHIHGAVFGSYVAADEVRVYGIDCPETRKGDPWIDTHWWDYCMATLTDLIDNTANIGWARLRANGRKLIIKRDKAAETEGGIMLTDSQQYRPSLATVISVGAYVSDIQPGDRISYAAEGLIDVQFTEDDDLAFIDQDGVIAVIKE